MKIERAWEEVHTYLRHMKTDNLDNIEAYKLLEELGDLMDYYEIFFPLRYWKGGKQD